MREKSIGRTYVAFVQGRLAKAKGRIDAPIGRDRHHPTRRRVSPTGESAVTLYERLETYPDAALVRLTLETGRTHQIRVHLSHLGHPLIGDALYGGRRDAIGRQALHGEALVFPHPFTNEPVAVSSPWPADFGALQERLKKFVVMLLLPNPYTCCRGCYMTMRSSILLFLREKEVIRKGGLNLGN